MPSQVNYVVKGGPILSPGEHVSGSSSVVSRFLSLHYLWDNVRVMGGAYGGFARFSETSGRFVYMSYRDPNLKATLDIYDKAPDALLGTHITNDDILQGVIGAIGDLDSPSRLTKRATPPWCSISPARALRTGKSGATRCWEPLKATSRTSPRTSRRSPSRAPSLWWAARPPWMTPTRTCLPTSSSRSIRPFKTLVCVFLRISSCTKTNLYNRIYHDVSTLLLPQILAAKALDKMLGGDLRLCAYRSLLVQHNDLAIGKLQSDERVPACSSPLHPLHGLVTRALRWRMEQHLLPLKLSRCRLR